MDIFEKLLHDKIIASIITKNQEIASDNDDKEESIPPSPTWKVQTMWLAINSLETSDW